MLRKFNGDNPIFKVLKFFFGDTVLIYAALILMSIMYHYRSSLAAVYGIAALITGALLFRLFDYISKHRLIGSAAYLAVFIAFIFGARLCIDKGSREYPLSFGVWFLTPQDALDYSKWYTLAIFLLFMIFMASVIYYFTKVRYRIFMNALIFIIPFALYGKEYEKMPTAYIMLLAMGYVITMIQCRQFTDTDKVQVVNKASMWMSAAVYVVIFASLAAIVPKPTVEADRELLETMISADQFTDRLVNLLTVFQDTSTGEQFNNVTDETPIYFVRADEPLRLKTRTFSTYDYESDSWSVTTNDTRYMYTNNKQEIKFSQTGELLAAILTAAEVDSDFAEKYNLEGFNSDRVKFPETRSTAIYTVSSRAQFAPVPPQVLSLTSTSYEDEIAVIRSGLIYSDEGYFAYNERFTYDYSANTFFSYPDNELLAKLMARDDYEQLLYDAYFATYIVEPEAYSILIDEYNNLEQHESYLNYGDNEQIYALAQQITAGLESDYDKALALEAYFFENGYLYDKNYKKEKGENAVDFLNTSKRGVCYEYATSMTLLARAAGIPARYCEGYNMSEQYNNERLGTNFVVKSKDAHGFPELYIRGVGWISFEPTVSALDSTQSENNATNKLSYAGIYLLILSLVFLLCIKFYPAVIHRILIIRLNKSDASTAAIFAMRRICRIYKTGSTRTSQEVAEYVHTASGCDISSISKLFDEVVYGKCEIPDTEKDTIIKVYISAYDAYNEMKRRKSKKAEIA